MSSFMHPAGPEPAAVYWIRRGAILLVLVTAVLALWWLVGALMGGGGDDQGASEPVASASVSAEPSASASASAQPDADPVECLDSAILVEASTDSSTYPVGSTPKLTLAISNTGDIACKRDVGPKANELEVKSGGYHVWSSDDCNASSKSKVVVLKPGEKVASAITWDGRLSQKGCPDGEGAAAKAGSYQVIGRNGKVTSDSTPFALRND